MRERRGKGKRAEVCLETKRRNRLRTNGRFLQKDIACQKV
ncbi:hypothetical protein M125_1328 [Bacteroides fragilis str. 3998T(B)3]|uniref:Uncharacterized protein n=1 Tax=Bacteroides fragilis str. 3998T(B)3 TaxID=1339316 RepID=A0A015W0X6_BACFG|nr:hypothetical protein M125_1328 [Bacteroides fragilis str. 3998T(B)3]